MPRPFLIFSQSDDLIRIVAINLHTLWQTVQIQINWLLQKPTDLGLHCLQRQDIPAFSRTRVNRWKQHVLGMLSIEQYKLISVGNVPNDVVDYCNSTRDFLGGGTLQHYEVQDVLLSGIPTLTFIAVSLRTLRIIIIIMSLFYEDAIFSKQCTNLTYGPL